MQKLIAIPMARYNNLVAKEQSKSGLKETIDATMNNLENQDLIQRQQLYRKIGEDMPKIYNKKFSQTAITPLPPPNLDKINKLRKKRDAEYEILYGKKSRKPVIKKKSKPKTVPVRVQNPKKPKFNLFDRSAFLKKAK